MQLILMQENRKDERRMWKGKYGTLFVPYLPNACQSGPVSNLFFVFPFLFLYSFSLFICSLGNLYKKRKHIATVKFKKANKKSKQNVLPTGTVFQPLIFFFACFKCQLTMEQVSVFLKSGKEKAISKEKIPSPSFLFLSHDEC